MNNYFINITKDLNLKPFDKNKFDIDIFENYISIKKYMKPSRIFFPEKVSKDDVKKEIRNLKVDKLST